MQKKLVIGRNLINAAGLGKKYENLTQKLWISSLLLYQKQFKHSSTRKENQLENQLENLHRKESFNMHAVLIVKIFVP